MVTAKEVREGAEKAKDRVEGTLGGRFGIEVLAAAVVVALVLGFVAGYAWA